jgi:hypothetical protein
MAMDDATANNGALLEAVAFLSYFKGLPDLRQRGKVLYTLEEVLLLALLAVLAGADSFVEIARFGAMKLAFLRRFRPFADGTPSHDHLGDILAALDADQFQRCFADWVASLIGVPAGVVAIDGKTVRRSGGKAGKGAIHMVSAFAAGQRLVLGQVKVALPPRDAIASFFDDILRRSLTDRQRKGCMLVNSTLEISPYDLELRKVITTVLSRIEAFFVGCIEAGQAQGTITSSMPAQSIAGHLLGVLMGVRVLARVRPERALLEGVVVPALALLDGPYVPPARGRDRPEPGGDYAAF